MEGPEVDHRFQGETGRNGDGAADFSGHGPSIARDVTMPSQDAEALADLARHCNEARANLPATGFHRLRVLLDMVLVDLAREGFCADARTEPAPEPEPTSRQKPT